MLNLFSTMDPTTKTMLITTQSNWSSMMWVNMIMPMKFWKNDPQTMTTMKKTIKKLNNEFKNMKIKKNTTIMFISMLFMMLMNNFMGLFPYMFTPTSHPTMNLTIASSVWVSIFLMSWTLKTKKTLAHQIPLSTPSPLAPFMVLIETISNLIRPLTLTVRLTANITAGHLLFALMSSNMNKMNMMKMTLVTMMQMLLFILEMSMSLIQAYVFTILCSMYSKEIWSYNMKIMVNFQLKNLLLMM